MAVSALGQRHNKKKPRWEPSVVHAQHHAQALPSAGSLFLAHERVFLCGSVPGLGSCTKCYCQDFISCVLGNAFYGESGSSADGGAEGPEVRGGTFYR